MTVRMEKAVDLLARVAEVLVLIRTRPIRFKPSMASMNMQYTYMQR
jgi:hypothetical protein